MTTALVWRLAAADSRGVPHQGGKAASVTIGATSELEGGGRVWFRVRPDGLGDQLSNNPVVAEVRDAERARTRCEQVTGMYRAKGWVVVDPPTTIGMPDPPVSPEEVLMGWPLQTWAEAAAVRFARR